MPKILNVTDDDHSTKAKTAKLKHGRRRNLLFQPRFRHRAARRQKQPHDAFAGTSPCPSDTPVNWR
ncbi:hypothetical protein [Loigolactobacillus jiayinensis]|uniref:Uncharacterized protein n=1 Tax=Loigolactobacillus jiayinensis TaxID=2486016 RepID=A0ABW1REB9_9LACO|nr:hypothetical protein [Loigolactobacillus jiayinensis]